MAFEAIEMAKQQKIIEDITTLDDDLKQFDLIAICAPLSKYQLIFTKLNSKINTNKVNEIMPANTRIHNHLKKRENWLLKKYSFKLTV